MNGPGGFTPSPDDIKGLTANQLVVFLERVLDFPSPLSVDAYRLMGEVYGLRNSTNIEVTNVYFRLGLKVGDREAIGPTVDLLGKIGRMKFVRPLYVFVFSMRWKKKKGHTNEFPQVSRTQEARSTDCARDV